MQDFASENVAETFFRSFTKNMHAFWYTIKVILILSWSTLSVISYTKWTHLMFSSCRNQQVELHCKSTYWFLHGLNIGVTWVNYFIDSCSDTYRLLARDKNLRPKKSPVTLWYLIKMFFETFPYVVKTFHTFSHVSNVANVFTRFTRFTFSRLITDYSWL